MLIYVEFYLSLYCLVTLSYKRLILLFFTVCLQGISCLEQLSIISKLCMLLLLFQILSGYTSVDPSKDPVGLCW